jgi:FG-GAP-like repeat
VNLLLSGLPWRSKLARRIDPLPTWLHFCLLVLLGSFFGSIPAQASSVILPVSGSRLPFAVDDFDGDLHPDVATVQQVSNNSSNTITIYKVQLELSAAGRQSIQLVGPAGGLRIVARDVNGDGVPDIVVSAAWREEPLAFLLSDGRGAFSLAEPSSFPGASGRSENTLNCNLPRPTDTVAIPRQSPVGNLSGSQYLLHLSPAAGSIPRANSVSFLSALLVSLPGRAPPKPSRL